MPVKAIPMHIHFVLDENDKTGFVVSTDPRTHWMIQNGGKKPPQHMEFKSEMIAQTYDAEYAIWIARIGELKSDLAAIIQTIQAAGSNPMAAIEGIQTYVERIMTFYAGINEQVKQVEVAAASEAVKLREAVAKQRQQQASPKGQKSS